MVSNIETRETQSSGSVQTKQIPLSDVVSLFARITKDTSFADDENPTNSTISLAVEKGVYEVYSIVMPTGQAGVMSNSGSAEFVPTLFLSKVAGNGTPQGANYPTDFELDLSDLDYRLVITGIIRVTAPGTVTFAFNPTGDGETLTILIDSFLRLKKMQ